jgi:putative phosphoesterase
VIASIRTEARSIAVIADCHIHRAAGVALPAAVLEALAGVDLIVTLGDMGESSGLDQLESVAPVVGVRGADDADDQRAAASVLVLEAPGARIGCLFDPVEAGLGATKDPFAAESDEALRTVFDGPVDIVLWASTHAPSVATVGGRLLVNPGSATLPDGGSAASFALLSLGEEGPEAWIVSA